MHLLMYAPSLTYAQLRPKGVESNHFAYHLEQLVKSGYIAKQTKGYGLTSQGLSFADRASHHNMTIRQQPHIVSTLCITNETGETLLFKHTFQPYLNLVGFPQGRLHYDEHIGEAAQRELLEKTGLQNVSLTNRGIAHVTAVKQDFIVSKIIAHVFSGTVNGTPEPSRADPKKGTAFWANHSQYAPQQCMPGFSEIKELLAANQSFFFTEIDCEMA